MGAFVSILFIIGQALLATSSPNKLPENQAAIDACTANIVKNRLITINVRPGLKPYYENNIAHPEYNVSDDTWVLIKENAPVPAWKAGIFWRGPRPGDTALYAEMEHVGTAIGLTSNNPDNGKEVFSGIGWCNPETNEPLTYENIDTFELACVDPLVQNLMFVVTHKGATREYVEQLPNENVSCDNVKKRTWLECFAWGEGKMSYPPRTQENIDNYWWRFNVYYKASKLPANATYDDLPCWVKLSCPGGSDLWGTPRLDAIVNPSCGPSSANSRQQSPQDALALQTSSVLGTVDPLKPKLLFSKAEIENLNPSLAQLQGITIADYYISYQETGAPNTTLTPSIGTLYNGYFQIRIFNNPGSDAPADHGLILDPRPAHDGPFWMFIPVTNTYGPERHTLQLGSFIPAAPSFFYEWWTPTCKPALYLYPEKTTPVSVNVQPNGHLTKTIPEHGVDGWKVIAHPDGRIENVGNSTIYPYLYYEAAVSGVHIPKTTGWVKHKDQLPLFFASVLPELGLNKVEIHDFIDYWLPKLQSEGNSWYITLIPEKEVDRVEKLTISPEPNTMIRVRFYFEKTTIQPSNNSTLTPPVISKKPRTGFTLVDWGGIMGNGSCGIDETVM